VPRRQRRRTPDKCNSDAGAFAIVAGKDATVQPTPVKEDGLKNPPKRHRYYREWGMKQTLTPGKEPVSVVSVARNTGTVGGGSRRKYAGRKTLPIFFFTFFMPVAGGVRCLSPFSFHWLFNFKAKHSLFFSFQKLIFAF